MLVRKCGNAFLGIVLVLWFSACASNTTTTTATVPDLPDSRARLIIGSDELLGAVEFHDVLFRRVGLFTQSQVLLENRTNQTLPIEYRVDWYDRTGFKAGGLNSWRFISLTANGSEILNSTGKVPEATQITVTVRLPEQMFESEGNDYRDEQYEN